MQTQLLKPAREEIRRAAEIIRQGGIVAFPTETVYGLGANALDENAVRKIFVAKGRPADNPLIVHICREQELAKLVQTIPPLAKKLMKRFWPGPLTIVFKKKKIVPDIVTAGLETVAVRMPANKVALALIKECGFPIAAPSANIAGKPSGTTAKHVLEDFEGKIDAIIDGERTRYGIESTVVAVRDNEVTLLRPGALSLESIQKVAKTIKLHPSLLGKTVSKPASPGMKYRHYAPKASVILVKESKGARILENTAKRLAGKGAKVAVFTTRGVKPTRGCLVLRFKSTADFSKNLFSSFRELDKKGIETILVDAVAEKGIGFALMNRIKKASEKTVGGEK
jgi:L-threonylcarbamoyladenylate synthase